METIQFEAVKTGLRQGKDGYILNLAMHPDDIPDDLVKDFVGARYMVVMVRLADTEVPFNRDEFAGAQMVKLAGMLCRDSKFWDYLYEDGQLFETSEAACIDWLQSYLSVPSRAEIKTNLEAQGALKLLYAQYKEWKNE
jgi:hypothetical protein